MPSTCVELRYSSSLDAIPFTKRFGTLLKQDNLMHENQDKYYTELDKNLQDLAAIDWPAFVQLVGPDNIMAAKICILRKSGKSYNQIAMKLHTTKASARWNSENCVCK